MEVMILQILGPADLEHITFPPANGLDLDQRNQNMAAKMLLNMDRGLLLQSENGSIYATRLCKYVFWNETDVFPILFS